MKLRISIIILSLTSVNMLIAQTDSTSIDSTDDDNSSLIFGLDLSSNTSTHGKLNGFSQPSLSPSISYSGKKGLWLNATGSFIGNSDSSSFSKTTSELDLSGGWDFSLFDDDVIISPLYTHYFHPNSAVTTSSFFTDQLELGIGGYFDWFRPSFTADYLFSTKNTINLNLGTAFRIKWKNVLKEGNTLKCIPGIDINYGDQSYFEKLAKKNYSFLIPYEKQFGDITLLELENKLQNDPTNRKKVTKLVKQNGSKRLSQITKASNAKAKYSFTSIDITFPLQYIWSDFTIKTAANFIIPISSNTINSQKISYYFSGGLSYTFDFK